MPQIPVQATYIPAQDELTLAWWVCIGTVLYALQHAMETKRAGKSLWQPWKLTLSVACAFVGYWLAVEFLEVALTKTGYIREIAEYPNAFGIVVGYSSHNLPLLLDAFGNKLGNKVTK